MSDFATELSELLLKHGVICNTYMNLVNYDSLMSERFGEELTTISENHKDTLRRMAAHYLETASLSESTKQYLEIIEGGGLPAPFKYGKIRIAGDENATTAERAAADTEGEVGRAGDLLLQPSETPEAEAQSGAESDSGSFCGDAARDNCQSMDSM